MHDQRGGIELRVFDMPKNGSKEMPRRTLNGLSVELRDQTDSSAQPIQGKASSKAAIEFIGLQSGHTYEFVFDASSHVRLEDDPRLPSLQAVNLIVSD